MRTRRASVVASLTIVVAAAHGDALANDPDFSRLRGPYLGQAAPGTTPQVFAPGVVSTDAEEGSCAFSSDGRRFWFVRRRSPSGNGILETEMVDGAWTPPRLAPFSVGAPDWDFVLAPDGRSMYISSSRPVTEGGALQENYRIWRSEELDASWSPPLLLPPVVNSGAHDSFPSVAQDGTLYFFSRRAGGLGDGDIYRAEPSAQGLYEKVTRFEAPINSAHDEVDPFIAPDQSYLIFCSNKPGGAGSYDIYISFRAADGSWSEATNLGPAINSEQAEYIPYLTRDGHYFFFTSDLPGQRDIYWMDASMILALRPQGTTPAGSAKSASRPVGDYLGQRPPGLVPEILAPGIVSTGGTFSTRRSRQMDASSASPSRRIAPTPSTSCGGKKVAGRYPRWLPSRSSTAMSTSRSLRTERDSSSAPSARSPAKRHAPRASQSGPRPEPKAAGASHRTWVRWSTPASTRSIPPSPRI